MAIATSPGARGLPLLLCLLVGVGTVLGEETTQEPSPAELQAQGELLDVLSSHFESLHPVEGVEVRFAELRAALARMQKQSEGKLLVRADLETLERELRLHSDDPSAYRKEYRSWVRLVAQDEEMAELKTTQGIRYEDVVVRRVTDVGMEIRHSNGTARLHCNELPEELHDRFQWDEEEAQAMLAREAARERVVQQIQRNAVLAGLDPVVRVQGSKRIVPGKIEPSAPIVPGKLEPSAPIRVGELHRSKRIVVAHLHRVMGFPKRR